MMTVGTHDGDFHADDVFAFAAIKFLNNQLAHIIRTRDPAKLVECDFVIDVGNEYNPERGRFDHHQLDGAGTRENGIPYSSFGLVWKEMAIPTLGPEIAEVVDKTLVQGIDAADNGFPLFEMLYDDVHVLTISSIISDMNRTPVHTEEENFFNAVDVAERIIQRKVQMAREYLCNREKVEQAIELSDKEIIVFDDLYRWQRIIHDKCPTALYVVFPTKKDKWMVQAVPVKPGSFDMKLPLPKSWGGLRDFDFQEETDIDDGIFCHRKLFCCAAKTKEGATTLAALSIVKSLKQQALDWFYDQCEEINCIIQTPHITVDQFGEVGMEWWKDQKKLSIYWDTKENTRFYMKQWCEEDQNLSESNDFGPETSFTDLYFWLNSKNSEM